MEGMVIAPGAEEASPVHTALEGTRQYRRTSLSRRGLLTVYGKFLTLFDGDILRAYQQTERRRFDVRNGPTARGS